MDKERKIKWDGDAYNPRPLNSQILPCPGTATLELVDLKNQVLRSRDEMRRINYAKCGDCDSVEARVRLFDGKTIVMRARNIDVLADDLYAHFSDPSLRWESVELMLADNASWKFPNRNQVTITTVTNGVSVFRRWKLEGSREAMEIASPLLRQRKEYMPRHRIVWARKYFDNLPEGEDLNINTLDEPEMMEGWCKFQSGKTVRFKAAPREVEKRLTKLMKGKKIVAGGAGRVPKEQRCEIHPLKLAKGDILGHLLNAEQLIKSVPDNSPLAQALALGMDLGMAIAQYEEKARTPDVLHARDMNRRKAGAKPKARHAEKRKHLLGAIAAWLRGRESTENTKHSDLVRWLWTEAQGRPDEFELQGDSRAGSIKHKHDSASYTAQQLQKKVIPSLRAK